MPFLPTCVLRENSNGFQTHFKASTLPLGFNGTLRVSEIVEIVSKYKPSFY